MQMVNQTGAQQRLPQELVDSGLQVERHEVTHEPPMSVTATSTATNDHLFFVAQQQPDGTYSVTLTEEGIDTFEIALGIAHDLSSKTPISPDSTIADIMDRTATREELTRLMRRGGASLLYRIRMLILQRKLRGSEDPSARQRAISRIGRALIVAIIGVWALQQFAIALQDIGDIPGILAGLPGDIVNLHPTTPFDQVGNRISDAYRHILIGVLGVCFTYIMAVVIRPFGKIYRKDQLLPGERVVLRLLNRLARTLETRTLDKRESSVTKRSPQ